MEPTLETIFEEQTKKLPREVVDFLLSSSWRQALNEIEAKYAMEEKWALVFSREVLLVLLGLVHPDAFRSMLSEEIGSYDETIDNAATEVDDRIFSSVRPALVTFFEEEKRKAEEAAAQGQASASENMIIPQEIVPEKVITAPREEVGAAPEMIIPQEITPAPIVAAPAPQEKELAPAPFVPAPERAWEKKAEQVPVNLPTEETTAQAFIPNLAPKTQEPEEPVTPPGFEDKMKKVFTGGSENHQDLAIETAPKPKSSDPYREPIE